MMMMAVMRMNGDDDDDDDDDDDGNSKDHGRDYGEPVLLHDDSLLLLHSESTVRQQTFSWIS